MMPNWLRTIIARMRAGGNHQNDFDRELESHLELEAEEQHASGISPGESRYAALRAFGNRTLIAEEVRAVWGANWGEAFVKDLQYGARVLRKDMGFTIVAVLTLGLGIGANTVIFSVIENVLLRPLPFTAADQVVRIYSTKDGSRALHILARRRP